MHVTGDVWEYSIVLKIPNLRGGVDIGQHAELCVGNSDEA